MKVDYWNSTSKIQLKENSTENFAEKNLKEDSKFNELWKFSMKQKKKKKNTQIQRTYFPDTLSDMFLANCTKIFNTLYFLSFSFSFLLYNIPF